MASRELFAKRLRRQSSNDPCSKKEPKSAARCSLGCAADPNNKKYNTLMLSSPAKIKDLDIAIFPGITRRAASRLRVNGITSTDMVITKLVEFKKDELCFVNWLMRTGHMPRVEADMCFVGLSDWCNEYM